MLFFAQSFHERLYLYTHQACFSQILSTNVLKSQLVIQLVTITGHFKMCCFEGECYTVLFLRIW